MNQTDPRFTYTTDDAGNRLTVIDSTTGLEFTARSVTDDPVTHEGAIDACASCRIGGHSDWALTSRQELLSLVDLSRYSPAIDTDAFPDFPSDWFWTADLCAWSSASAWLVLFDYGLVSDYLRYGYGFALAVRRAGQ
ncbi:DUF1566 domain-containing protein [Stenotrophomonas sp. MH181796]|uniref:Lcl C-terminal domain-containing protein n=1 Tax=Stenotrophomonas sp. MH181796 TaxID=2339228 RepID=UPI00129CE0F6|nr:DUF1566 domain-containing protein [Stenotrophomonas sp. MH181796]MRI44305.1 DUF1566 domain-containing protein [Stenotrophomonas sp. MH181796]